MNAAIAEAHERGVLTSASLMVTGDAWHAAVQTARELPSLSVGLHLVLVSGRAALPPSSVPHLVDSEGRFRENPVAAGLVYQLRAAARRELRSEIRAQLRRFRESGLTLAHVDGHLHMHVHPVVLDILADLASEFDIPSVRLPAEELRFALSLDRGRLASKAAYAAVFGLLRRHGVKRLRLAGVAVADRVYGLQQTGRVSEDYLARLLPRISADWSELYCHPARELPGEPRNGPRGAGERELAALLSPRVRDAAVSAGLALTGSRDAAARRRGAAAGGASSGGLRHGEARS